ncbi:MAG: hypothetical protein ACTH2Q_08140 [Propionibacteriaceae bacterium]
MGTTESLWSIDPGTWVEAAPFRAHLHHLMDTTGQTWQVVAEVARISLPDAHRLLHGRRGRPVRRISPQTASRLFWVDRRQLVQPVGMSNGSDRAGSGPESDGSGVVHPAA